MKHLVWIAAVMILLTACGGENYKTAGMKDNFLPTSTRNRVVVKDEKFVYPKTNVIAWKQYLIDVSHPIVADGKVFVARTTYKEGEGNQRELVCIDAFTGELLWSEKYDIDRSPEYSSGNLILKQRNGTLLCIDSKNRKKIWSNKGIVGSSFYTVAQNGRFFINESNGITCFDVRTGEKIWVKDLPKNGISKIAMFNNRLIYLNKNELFCVRDDNGNQIWKQVCPNGLLDIVTYKESLFYVDYKYILHRLDSNGTEVWKREFASFSKDYEAGLSFCVAEGKVYVADRSIKLNCLDAENGKILSCKPIDRYQSNITYYDGCIYYCNRYGICMEDLTNQGRSAKIEFFDYSPYFMSYSIANGNIYFIQRDTGLLCINARTGTNAITYKKSQTKPVQILNDGKCWVGENGDSIGIFKNDKQAWKNDEKIVSFYLDGNEMPSRYLDYDNHIVYIKDEKKPRLECINKTTGKTIWEKPSDNYIITGFDKKTVTCENNLGNMQTIDVASGKTDSKKREFIREGLDEYTDFVIHLVNGPDLFSFQKINDHQHIVVEYYIGGKSSGPTDLLIINDDGSVVFDYGRDGNSNHELTFSVKYAKSDNRLYVHGSRIFGESDVVELSKEVDLTTGKTTDIAPENIPEQAVPLDCNPDYFNTEDKNPLVKNLAYQGEGMSDAEFEKLTGLKPLVFEKTDDYFTPVSSTRMIKLGNANICYRSITFPSPDRETEDIDYLGIFDPKTFKSLWTGKGVQTHFKQVGEKLLLVECDQGISLIDIMSGKVALRMDISEECSIVDDILFVAQRKSQHSRSVDIKAINLKKIIEKFK